MNRSALKKHFFCFRFLHFIVALFFTELLNSQVVTTYVYTGGMQTYSVPACATSITISAYGAQGQSGIGGNFGVGALGGLAQGVIAVIPGQVYNIFVGGQTGYNGGGSPGTGIPNTSGSGGGASDVRFGGIALANRIIVGAGGGGGAGGPQVSCSSGFGGNGGIGGNLTGGSATQATGCGLGGSGGTGGSQVAGGTGGLGNSNCAATAGNGGAGALATGGAGGNGIIGCACYTGSGGGGGGGGYYGGGGGGGGVGGCGGSFAGGGGGGGSSWTGALASPLLTSGTQAGNGRVIITDNCAVLPIQLVTFEAKYNTNLVDLNWTTATEQNSKFFTIEKSMDGNDYVLVASVNAAGNSLTEKKYHNIDNSPNNGVIYYRLKEFGGNGSESYSKTIALEINEKIFKVKLMPNPAQENVQLLLSDSFMGETISIELMDILGQTHVLKQGLMINDSKQPLTLDIHEFSSGLYFITIIGSDGMIIKNKLIKN